MEIHIIIDIVILHSNIYNNKIKIIPQVSSQFPKISKYPSDILLPSYNDPMIHLAIIRMQNTSYGSL